MAEKEEAITADEKKSPCEASLIELRNAIKQELADESAASHKYYDMAAKFSHLKEPEKADTLRLIAGQELLHHAVLSDIVDKITEKCGE